MNVLRELPKSFELYLCPFCGKTVRQDYPTTYMINTICNCNYPESVTQMVKVFPPEKKKE